MQGHLAAGMLEQRRHLSKLATPFRGLIDAAVLRVRCVAGLLEAVLPARMGTSFRWLVGSTWISNLGDGMGLAAGPLLIASQTRDPVARRAGGSAPAPALAAVRPLCRGAGRPRRPPAHRRHRRSAARRGPGRADRDAVDRVGEHRRRARCDAAAGDGEGLCRHGHRHAAADGRRRRGPRYRQRPTHDRLSHRRPARRPGRRRRAVRRGDGVAVPDPVDLRRARSPAGGPDAVAGSPPARGARASASMSSRASGSPGATRRCARSPSRSSRST